MRSSTPKQHSLQELPDVIITHISSFLNNQDCNRLPTLCGSMREKLPANLKKPLVALLQAMLHGDTASFSRILLNYPDFALAKPFTYGIKVIKSKFTALQYQIEEDDTVFFMIQKLQQYDLLNILFENALARNDVLYSVKLLQNWIIKKPDPDFLVNEDYKNLLMNFVDTLAKDEKSTISYKHHPTDKDYELARLIFRNNETVDAWTSIKNYLFLQRTFKECLDITTYLLYAYRYNPVETVYDGKGRFYAIGVIGLLQSLVVPSRILTQELLQKTFYFANWVLHQDQKDDSKLIQQPYFYEECQDKGRTLMQSIVVEQVRPTRHAHMYGNHFQNFCNFRYEETTRLMNTIKRQAEENLQSFNNFQRICFFPTTLGFCNPSDLEKVASCIQIEVISEITAEQKHIALPKQKFNPLEELRNFMPENSINTDIKTYLENVKSKTLRKDSYESIKNPILEKIKNEISMLFLDKRLNSHIKCLYWLSLYINLNSLDFNKPKDIKSFRENFITSAFDKNHIINFKRTWYGFLSSETHSLNLIQKVDDLIENPNLRSKEESSPWIFSRQGL